MGTSCDSCSCERRQAVKNQEVAHEIPDFPAIMRLLIKCSSCASLVQNYGHNL